MKTRRDQAGVVAGVSNEVGKTIASAVAGHRDEYRNGLQQFCAVVEDSVQVSQW